MTYFQIYGPSYGCLKLRATVPVASRSICGSSPSLNVTRKYGYFGAPQAREPVHCKRNLNCCAASRASRSLRQDVETRTAEPQTLDHSVQNGDASASWSLAAEPQVEQSAADVEEDGFFVEEEEDKLLAKDFWDTSRERVYLVGVRLKGDRSGGFSVDESLEELARLADTAGLKVVGSTHQVLAAPNVATYIGMGKVAEVADAVKAYHVDTVVFDDELSPGQLRNLERALSPGSEDDPDTPRVRVCDRTALILDIFSQRAATREGKLQVELASVEYQLPRLTRMWSHLDRVGGGGQVKGTGEKQIEMDKRLLRDKAALLRRELEEVRTHRRAYRERRQSTPVPVAALVGYTNAGKSTLLNTLTNAGVLAEDKLFATLDPTTRKVRLPSSSEVLVSDTVGFIQKLPTQLVAAFRATLEEIADASLLLHIVDASHPNAQGQAGAVIKVLDELDVSHIPMLTVWNKMDACSTATQVRALVSSDPHAVCISGRTGEGVAQMMRMIGDVVASSMTEVQVLLPFAAGDLLDAMYSHGSVTSTEYTWEGVQVRASVPPALLGRLQLYGATVLNSPAAETELLTLPPPINVGSSSVDLDLDLELELDQDLVKLGRSSREPSTDWQES